jgi:hypothetical protein
VRALTASRDAWQSQAPTIITTAGSVRAGHGPMLCAR